MSKSLAIPTSNPYATLPGVEIYNVRVVPQKKKNKKKSAAVELNDVVKRPSLPALAPAVSPTKPQDVKSSAPAQSVWKYAFTTLAQATLAVANHDGLEKSDEGNGIYWEAWLNGGNSGWRIASLSKQIVSDAYHGALKCPGVGDTLNPGGHTDAHYYHQIHRWLWALLEQEDDTTADPAMRQCITREVSKATAVADGLTWGAIALGSALVLGGCGWLIYRSRSTNRVTPSEQPPVALSEVSVVRDTKSEND
jgi:hypothetical protein